MQIAKAYQDYISCDRRYAFLIGGAGAGKSETAARKTVLRAIQGGRHLVIRKYATTLKQSVIHVILNILQSENISYTYTKSDASHPISCGAGEILFLGLDDSEKLKSIAAISSVWVEEASEITEEDFNQIDLRIRGKTNFYKQITCTLNPVMRGKWVLDVIKQKNEADVYQKVYTYKDNPFLDEEYKKMLENINDKRYKNVYVNGQWDTSSDALVFNNVYTKEIVFMENDSVIYGLDFGFNNPTALVGVKQEDGEYLVKELLYKTHMTNNELISFLKDNLKQGSLIYCDSAEPARIEEIRRAGFRAVAANKDVRGGVAWMRSNIEKIRMDGANLVKEATTYSYKLDRENKATEEIVKVNDHLLDAMRYALYTHYSSESKKISEKDVAIFRRLNEFI